MKFYSFKISQTVKAPKSKVYATWTNRKLAKKFTSPPGCVTTSFKTNFKVGGKYQTTMETPHGPMKNSGEYLEIIPGKKIIQTFVWEAPDTELNVIIIEFEDRGKNTVLTLTGMGFSVKAEAQGNRQGWKGSITHFAEYFTK